MVDVHGTVVVDTLSQDSEHSVSATVDQRVLTFPVTCHKDPPSQLRGDGHDCLDLLKKLPGQRLS